MTMTTGRAAKMPDLREDEPEGWVLRIAETLTPDKINLAENVQVASEPAGNFRRPSPSEENPVDGTAPALPLVTVTLSLTVPGEQAAAVSARLTSTLSEAIADGGGFSRASVELWVDDTEEE